MPKIHANGIDLHYISSGHGPEIVMLHGFLGNLAVWHLQIVPQLRTNYRITTYDLRGHGYSTVTPTGYKVPEMADDLLAFLDAAGIEKPVLVGHSFGADIAMNFSYRHPDRVSKLVAIEPGLACLLGQRKDKNWVGWQVWVEKLEELGLTVPEDKKADVEYLLQLSLETPKFYGPARGLPRNREPLLNLIRNTSLCQDYEYVGDFTLDAVAKIQTPLMLIYGAKSHFLGSFETLREVLPNARKELIPGGEHFGPLETPDHLVELIKDFVGSDAEELVYQGQVAAASAPMQP